MKKNKIYGEYYILLILLVFICLIVIFYPGSSQAATYYVSPAGLASWPSCTNVNTPCSAATAMANAAAGDVVYFRGGSYSNDASSLQGQCLTDWEYPCMNPANSGTAGNPITFIAYPGETPVIVNASSNYVGAAFGAGHRSYITWDGFTGTLNPFTSSDPQLIGIWFSDHITIRNCNLTGFLQVDHTNSALIYVEQSSYVTIENNRLHDMNGYVSGEPQYKEEPVNSVGIMMFYTLYVTIKNNDIYNNWTAIYDKDDGNHNVYYYNHIWGTGSGHQRCIEAVQEKNQVSIVGNGSDRKLYQNVIRNCYIGVLLDTGLTFSNVMIYNNVFYGMGPGYGILHLNPPSSTGASTGATQVQIFNDVFYDFGNVYTPVTQNGAYFNFYDKTSFTYVNNNIFYDPSPVTDDWNINYGNSGDYPTLPAWTAATTFDGNSYVENPQFANPNGSKASDYKINATHKNSGRGGSYPSVIGAYVAGNEHIGYLPPPSNLR
jgi:hypothetical protein